METTTPRDPKIATFSKTKAHQRYRLKSGDIVPGATTVLGILNKPALLAWAWQCGIDGIDFRKVKDNAADIGTLAHWMVECHIQGLTPNLDPFSKEDTDKAENSFLKFLEWFDGNEFKPVETIGQDGIPTLNEVQLVSEKYRYGGTLDLPCVDREGRMVLVDLKTSKGVYDEYWYQLAAYSQLYTECTGSMFQRHIICRIGKKEVGDFEVVEKGNIDKYWDVFESCLRLHEAMKRSKA